MRKTIFGCLGAAVVAFTLHFTLADVQAGLFSACNPCDEVADCNPCDDADSCDPCDAVNCGTSLGKWFLNGHMEAGFFANGHGNKAQYNNWGGYGFAPSRGYDGDTGNTALLQNTRLTGAQINQVYVSMGKTVDGRRGWDFGGTVDITWGSDAYNVQARGMEYGAGHGGPINEGRWGTGDYYAAFAQAYFEAAYGRWNFIAGKFAAPFGIDDYKSTENFFYSWSPTQLISPNVGGGAYATYKASDKLTLIGGWVMPEEIGEGTKYNCVLGGFVWTPVKRFNLRYAFAAGDNTYNAENGVLDLGSGIFGHYNVRGDNVFVHSLTATAQISQRLKYVFDWTLLNVTNSGNWYDTAGINGPVIDGGNWRSPFAAYAIMNEVIFQYNKKWAFGTRFGVLNENLYGSDADWYTVSLGANWTPNKWLTVKPEVRYDWFDGDGWTHRFNGTLNRFPINTYQVSGGMSAVVKF